MMSPSALRPARPRRHRVVSATLRSPLRQVLGQLTLLEYAATDGHVVRLPVQYARWSNKIVVAAGHAQDKTWWRAFRSSRRATMLLDGSAVQVAGHLVGRDERDWPVVAAAYAGVHRMARLDDAELVLLQRI